MIVLDLGGWNVGRFITPLLFPSGDQCCDALACPRWESSWSLGAPLPCQAADQMLYLLCLPVYLPVHSHWLRRAQDSRSTEVFVAEDCAWLCAIPDSTFCRRFIESVRMMAWVICASRWEASHCIACVTASNSMVRLEVVTVGSTVFVHSPSTLLDCEPHTRPVHCDWAVCVDDDVMWLAVGFDKLPPLLAVLDFP